MKEQFAFISALNAAVISINSIGWAAWAAIHSADTYFQKIQASLLVYQPYYKQASITAVCQYMVAENKVPDVQLVPSEDFWPYKQSARFSDNRGVIQKRVKEHLLRPRSGATVGAPGSWRFGTWEIFQKCQECLSFQPPTSWNENKMDGPMGRDTWFDEAIPSGLFWVNYFAQQTLDWMYGPGKPNVWPFDFATPPWCVETHLYWKLNAYAFYGNASLQIIYFPPPGGSYGKGLNLYIRLYPDENADNPGNMNVGHLFSQQASMNEEYEIDGEYSEVTLDPLPSSFTPMDLSVTQYQDDPWLYQVLEFLEMDGSYIIEMYVSKDLAFNEPYDYYYDEFGGEWY